MASPQRKKRSRKPNDPIKALDGKIEARLKDFQESRDGPHCYPLLMHGASIGSTVVDDVFDDLRNGYRDCGGRLDVIVDSAGGDIDAAYNLSLLLRRFGTTELNFFVPRWAKSAATLLVCAGDKVIMSPVAELGPLDPQITVMNPMEQRLEHFSPLHIDATLSLIRDEFENGNENLAQGLINRLQFPLTLGSFKKSIDIGVEYVSRLLSSRMLRDKTNEEVQVVARTLAEGYADHGFCIDIEEARNIGLTVAEPDETQLDILWDIHKLSREREHIKMEQKRKELDEVLKELPSDLADKLSIPRSHPTEEVPYRR